MEYSIKKILLTHGTVERRGQVFVHDEAAVLRHAHIVNLDLLHTSHQGHLAPVLSVKQLHSLLAHLGIGQFLCAVGVWGRGEQSELVLEAMYKKKKAIF